jgi:hypothetical protein
MSFASGMKPTQLSLAFEQIAVWDGGQGAWVDRLVRGRRMRPSGGTDDNTNAAKAVCGT